MLNRLQFQLVPGMLEHTSRCMNCTESLILEAEEGPQEFPSVALKQAQLWIQSRLLRASSSGKSAVAEILQHLKITQSND